MAYDTTKFFVGTITSLSVGGSDIGGTGAEVFVNFNIEKQLLTCGQSRSSVGSIETKKEYQISFSAAEYDLDNLAVALGQPAANLSGETSLTLTSDAADEVAIIAVINNDQASKDFTITLNKCKIATSGGIRWNTEQQGFLELTFDVFAFTGSSLGNITYEAE